MVRKVDTYVLLERMDEFSRLFKKLNGMILEYYNLSESALLIFTILKDEELTLKELTEASKLDKSTVSRQVNALVKKDLLHKEQGEDKRFTYLKLSEEAKELHKQYKAEADKAFDDLLSDWTEQEKQTLSVLLLRLNRRFIEAL